MRPKKPHLKKRKDGRYACRYEDKWFYGSTEKEALQKRDEYLHSVVKKSDENEKVFTFSEYSDKWLKSYKAHLTEGPINTHKRNINKWISLMGDKNLIQYTPSDISFFYEHYRDMSFSFLHSLQHTIKSIFKSAYSDGLLKSDLLTRVLVPKGTKGTHRAITPEERYIIHMLRHSLRPAVMTMLYAGLRRGEILALNIDRDVDFNKKTITITESIRFQGNKPLIVAPKTEAGKRKVPLLAILYSELEGKHGLLCPSAKEALMTETSWSRAWESYVKCFNKAFELEFGYKNQPLRPHDLRHSFCTMMYDMDIDLKSAMYYMGHSDSSTTLQIYTHLSNLRKVEAENKLRTMEDVYLSRK